MGEIFAASRWTGGNLMFPTVIEVTGTAIIRRKSDAIRIKALIEAAQTEHLHTPVQGGEEGATRICPFCAERVKSAATVYRFCGKDLPREASRG